MFLQLKYFLLQAVEAVAALTLLLAHVVAEAAEAVE
jgi:hypothetical protein